LDAATPHVSTLSLHDALPILFQDPVRKFNPMELQWVSATLDANGRLPIREKININGRAPGMLQVTFNTKVFEGGGDFSLDVFTKDRTGTRLNSSHVKISSAAF